MANIFDQFDEQPVTPTTSAQPSNIFDQFDEDKPTQAAPTIDEPTPEELEAASKPAMLSKRQIIGRAPALEAARARPQAVAPSLTAATPVPFSVRPPLPKVATGRDFTGMDEEITKAIGTEPKPLLLPEESRKTRQMGVPSLEATQVKKDRLSIEQAATLPQTVGFMREYIESSRPNLMVPKEPKQVADLFRDLFIENTYEQVSGLVRVANATPRQRELEVKALELSKKLDVDWGGEVKSMVLDPINYVGLGVGKIVKESLIYGGASLLKTQLGAGASAATVEGVIAGYTNNVDQQRKIELGLQESVDYSQMAVAVGASVLIEGVATGAILGKDIKKNSDRIAQFKAANPPEELDAATEKFKEEFIKREKKITEPLYESAEARQAARDDTFGEAVPLDDPYQAVMSKPIVDDIFKITKQLFVDNPDLRFKLEEVKTVDNIVKILGDTEPEQLQQAAARAGVSPEKFLEMFKVQASEAGAFLQQSSAMSKVMRGMFEGDPALEKAFNRMLDMSAGQDPWIKDALTSIKNITGASVGAMTLGYATTVFNAIGLAGTITIKTAGDTLEAMIKAGTRMLTDFNGGEVPIKELMSPKRIREEIEQVFEDSVFLIKTMWDGGYSAELAQMAAKNNPRTAALLNSASAEFDMQGKGKLNEAVRTLNIANRAVDAIIRGPVYVQSLRDRMRDVGLDYEKFLANDTPIPKALDKLASEDAMKLTFSYQFKEGTGGIEGEFEDVAFGLLKFVDKYTSAGIIKDLAFPFARFTLNLVRYTYRMTPLSAGISVKGVGTGGMGMLKRAAKLREEGKFEEAARLSYDGKAKIRDATVGSALILATMLQQRSDPDVPMHQDRDKSGNLVDISGIAPYAQIKALGAGLNVLGDVGFDLMYSLKHSPEERIEEADKLKQQADTLDKNDPKRAVLLRNHDLLKYSRIRNFDGVKFIELLTGLGRASMTQDTIFDKAKEWFEDGIKTSAQQKAGQVAADFIGRFDNFANPFYDAGNAFLAQNEIKDPKATIPGDDEFSPFLSQMVRSLQAQTPFKGSLQNRPDLFQPMDMKADPFARNLFGVRSTPPTTALKNEFERIGIAPYSVLKTTGNRDLDNILVRQAGAEFRNNLTELINSKEYKDASNEVKKDKLETTSNKTLSAFKKDAQELFLEQYGQAAIDMAYSKAPSRKAQENNFVDVRKRKPTSNIDKFQIIEGDYIDIGTVDRSNVDAQMEDMLTNSR